MTENLVLAMAFGYNIEQLRPFVSSCARHCADTHLHLFVNNEITTIEEIIPSSSVQDVTDYLHAFADMQQRVETARYFAYRRYLRTLSPAPAMVLLTDSRDVVFQSDPFSHAYGAAASFASEDRSISQCQINSHWIRESFGQDELDRLKDFKILCSGTTLGTYDGIMQYLDLMCEWIWRANTRVRLGATLGIDQGIHNIVVRRHPWIGAILQNHSIISTLAHTPPTDLHWQDDRLFVREFCPAIVHQYDRHAAFRKDVARLAVS